MRYTGQRKAYLAELNVIETRERRKENKNRFREYGMAILIAV